ncbi:CARDB domain-containing protein [Haloarchaeobius sp. DYHT-AS-18]|uniref:CARDB domain-containing protein n=1 Tax=Haloarchaeobius sp. DYHT-AS-18 TaxID=3446117 RepID=UPI003EBE482F
MTSRELRSWLQAALVAAVVCGMLAAAVSGPVGAQSSTVVTFSSDSTSFEDSTTMKLMATNAPTDDGVGAYELTLTYDSDVVDVDVSGTDRFDVSTDTDGSSGEVTMTVVGYTGATNASGANVTLATVTVTSKVDSADTTLSVGSIETFADTNGDPISHSNDASVDLGVESSGGSGDSGGAGGGGGGQSDGPAGTVKISDWSVSDETVAPGEQVTMTVTVSNTADETKTITPALYVDGELIEGKRVSVLKGTERTVNFTYRFEETGTHSLSPDGQDFKFVTVEGAGETSTAPPSTTQTQTPTPTETDEQAETTAGTVASDDESTGSPEPTDTTESGASSGGIPGFTTTAAMVALLSVAFLARSRVE